MPPEGMITNLLISSNVFLVSRIVYIEDPQHDERPFVDEKQAIARLKQGDLGGLEALVRMYQLQAVRAACMIVGDRDLAEDIVQNAFIRAGERIEQFDARRPFGPWFTRSVVNDAVKAANRQKRMVSLDQETGEGLWDQIYPKNLVDPQALPEEQVECKETARTVWQALQKLPPNQRAVIILRYYLDMREDEMTAELHSPPGTIKWWLYAARQRLAKLLRPLRPSDPPTFELQSQPERDRVAGGKR